MIASIHLENFQGHENTFLEFSEGLNTLIGESDNGKSSVVRAIEWVSDNEPTGDEFVNDDSDWCRVTMVISHSEEMYTIIKTRKKSKTKYELIRECCDDPDPYSQVFEACGRDVPIEVKKVINFNDSNIQGQLDEFYLVADKPGKVAKELQEFAGLSEISTYNKTLNQKVRSVSASIKAEEVNIEGFQEKLKDCFSDKKLDELEELNTSLLKGIKRIQKLSSTISSINTLTDTVSVLRADLKALREGETDLKKLRKLYSRYIKLTDDIFQLAKLKVAFHSLSAVSDNLPNKTVIDKLTKSARELEVFKNQTTRVSAAVEAYAAAADLVIKGTKKVKKLKKEHATLLKDADECPVCGSEL